MSAHLEDAGHILGSAAVVLDIQEMGARIAFVFLGYIANDATCR